MTTTGYYLTYNSGAGIIGYTGGKTPFLFCDEAICFKTRKEARDVWKHLKKTVIHNLNHHVARHFAIVDAAEEDSVNVIRNVYKIEV